MGAAGLLARIPGLAAAQAGDIGAADARCEKGPVISNRRCSAVGCRNRFDCFCARTTSGEKKCIHGLFEQLNCNRSQCRNDDQCPPGEFCVEVGACCGVRNRTLCASPCV
jgi:hypothetical protein